MKLTQHHTHPWDVAPAQAIAIQEELRAHVREEPLPHPIQTVAGIDMSVRGDRVQAAVVVLCLPELEIVDQAVWRGPVAFPYVPGLLSFRELPPLLEALSSVSLRPDLLMTDSQGKAHMRQMGLASHLGILLDWPALGVAKSRLVGQPIAPLAAEKGSHVPLVYRNETVGAAVRTRTKVNPVYVSVGHRITLPEAIEITLACTTRYKIPEPTRQAHLLSRKQ